MTGTGEATLSSFRALRVSHRHLLHFLHVIYTYLAVPHFALQTSGLHEPQKQCSRMPRDATESGKRCASLYKFATEYPQCTDSHLSALQSCIEAKLLR